MPLITASPSSERDRLARTWLIPAAKTAIAVLLVSCLVYFDAISLPSLRSTFIDLRFAVTTFAILLFGHVLAMFRWYILMRALGISIRLRACVEIFAMGTFANTFLPGSTSGDLVRAVYVARDVRSDRLGAVLSILADRALGLLGLVGLTILIGLAVAEQLTTIAITQIVSVTAMAAVTGTAATFVLITPARFDRIRDFVGTRTVLHRAVLRAVEVAVQLRAHPGAIIACFLLSLLVAMTIAISIVMLSQTYGKGGLTALDFSYAGIMALIANVIPITPGGIGVGEGTFAFLCYAWERVPTALPYATIFLGYRLLTTLISLIGGIGFVTYQRHQPSHSVYGGPSDSH